MKLEKSPYPHDFLKFWRVIRYYVKSKHQIGQADLDILLFLFSEGYFGKEKFDEFAQLVSWEYDRFERLLKQGWIEIFRVRQNYRKLYQLSSKANNVIKDIYRKLNGKKSPLV